MFKQFRKKSVPYLGKQKTTTFDFTQISSFFHFKDHRDSYSVISDQTCTDLGLDELFMFTDRTSSRVGQQYLYNTLRVIPDKINTIKENEKTITELAEKKEVRSALVEILSTLNTSDAYSIVSLMEQEVPVIPVSRMYFFLVLKFLPTLFLLLWILSHSGYLMAVFIVSLVVNLCIHYWNKQNSWGYLLSVPQLIRLLDIAKKMMQYPIAAEVGHQIPAVLASLKKLMQNTSIFRAEPEMQGELAMFPWLVKEYIHIFFLSEPLTFIKFVSLLKDKNKDVETAFTFVGLVDSLISVSFLREDLPFYCRPEEAPFTVKMEAEELYHPLIPDCISNSFEVKEKSILLTGSNMSGKTTFIRTAGISILTAQVLNTAFAWRLCISAPVAVHSALMLADNLSEGKSFYLKEVDTIKEMLECSREGKRNLFLLDEIFKGTNTTERIAAAKAVLSFLSTKNNLIFVSTHDTELASLLENEYDLYYFCETVDNSELTFDYKLKSGKLTRRNAIRILEIKNFPPTLIDDAYCTIRNLENHIPV